MVKFHHGGLLGKSILLQSTISKQSTVYNECAENCADDECKKHAILNSWGLLFVYYNSFKLI